MKTYVSDLHELSFNKRISNKIKKSILFILVYSFLGLLIFSIAYPKKIIWDSKFLLLFILFYIILFAFSSISFTYKSNRFLIKKISLGVTKIYIEYDECGSKKQAEYSINDIKFKLVQWYHTNSIYLKINVDGVTIKQYAGIGWSPENLREVFKALKEAQKNLEGEPE